MDNKVKRVGDDDEEEFNRQLCVFYANFLAFMFVALCVALSRCISAKRARKECHLRLTL
jgi:hypothetical protein